MTSVGPGPVLPAGLGTPPHLSRRDEAMSVDEYTNNMDALKKDGPADVKLSDTTRDKYVNIIFNCKNALKTRRAALNGLENLGNVGTLGSARETQTNLQTGVLNAQQVIDKYIEYLDSFEALVKKAADRLIKSG
jgi:hypothetical protein